MEARESGSRERQLVGRRKLPRLRPEWYQGDAAVFWTLCINQRQTGWLAPQFREQWSMVLLHCCARYSLISPGYVLMPDHVHVVLMGLHANSDQLQALKFLKQYTRRFLQPFTWQKQSHDHILRRDERTRGAFAAALHYILQNPVRAGIVGDPKEYPYLGCCIPGYPDMEVCRSDYWEVFWNVREEVMRRAHELTLAAT